MIAPGASCLFSKNFLADIEPHSICEYFWPSLVCILAITYVHFHQVQVRTQGCLSTRPTKVEPRKMTCFIFQTYTDVTLRQHVLFHCRDYFLIEYTIYTEQEGLSSVKEKQERTWKVLLLPLFQDICRFSYGTESYDQLDYRRFCSQRTDSSLC